MPTPPLATSPLAPSTANIRSPADNGGTQTEMDNHASTAAVVQLASNMSSLAVTRPKNLFDFSGELRNKIYRAHFDELDDADIAKNRRGYVLATRVRSFLNILEVSKKVRLETHGMFFLEYFPRSRYALQGLGALRAFLKLSSSWIHADHALQLRSSDPDVGLAYLSTMDAVLENSVGLGKPEQTTTVALRHPTLPLGFDVRFESWEYGWQQLNESPPYGDPVAMGLMRQYLPHGFVQATIHRVIFSNLSTENKKKSTYSVYMEVTVDDAAHTTWFLRGKLSGLNMSCLLKDLAIFVDNADREVTAMDAAKAVRIIKGLESKLQGKYAPRTRIFSTTYPAR